MTHNIIHDEDNIEEIVLQWLDDKSMIYESKMAMKQYAEHYLIKHIDSEIERLRGCKEMEMDMCDPDDSDCRVARECIFEHNRVVQSQIESLQSLKSELTKSK